MPESTIEIPPQDLEAERATLGSMMVERRALNRARLLVAEGDFYQDKHRIIYRALCTIADKGEESEADIVTVGSQLRDHKKFGDAGGKTYLMELLESVATAAHIEHYASIVKKKSLERQVIKKVIALRLDPTVKKGEAIQDLLLKAAGSNGTGIFDMRKDLAAGIDDLFDSMKDGISLGMEACDGPMHRWKAGEIWPIGGRTNAGKTALILRLALNIAQNIMVEERSDSVLIITSEMTRNELMGRLVPMVTDIFAWKFRENSLRKDEYRIINDAMVNYLSKLPLQIYEHPRPGIEEIRAAAMHSGASTVFIDVLQNLRMSDKEKVRAYQVQEFMIELKSFAKTSKIRIAITCQLDRLRDKNPQPPVMSDLRDSGGIEMVADVITLLWRPPLKEDGTDGGPPIPEHCTGIEAIWPKHRGSEAGAKTYMSLEGRVVRMAGRYATAPPEEIGYTPPKFRPERNIEEDPWYND